MSRRNERGVTLVMFTMMVALVIIPMIGLAIDGSILYWTKAKLSAAVDAGALAAGRDLSADPTTTAQNYIYANLPPGWLGSSYSPAPTVTVALDTPTLGTRRVTVAASVTVPLYFMRFLGQPSTIVSASGVSSRRDTNIILIIDRSYSMQLAGACSTMIASAQSFINNFANGRDTLSLISFSTTANADFGPTQSFQPGLNTKLGTAVCNGYTNTAAALNLAYTQIRGIAGASSKLNVIVLFTDGVPDSVQGDFQGDGTTSSSNVIKKLIDVRYNWQSPYTLVSGGVAASTCNSSAHLTGIVVDTPGTTSPPPLNNQTGGVYNPIGVPISTNILLPGLVSNACGSFSSNELKMRNDIAYLPPKDALLDPSTGLGNLLTGFRTAADGSDTYPSGNPYLGKLRSDSPQSIMHASENAADAQARTIRNDTTYKPIIYTIGLGGTSSQPIDDELLERIANDPRSTSHDSSNTGEYIPCTAAGLASAFQQVASQILHLSK
jgi:Flp pilus assembly protein TadG